MSQAGSFAISSLPPGTVVETLTGNTGGPVGPDLLDNINIIGDGTTITVAGSAITNTLTISALSSGGATSFPTDSGTATPDSNGNLQILGGENINTSAATNVVTVNLNDDIDVDSMSTSNLSTGLTIHDNTIQAIGSSPNININILPDGSSGFLKIGTIANDNMGISNTGSAGYQLSGYSGSASNTIFGVLSQYKISTADATATIIIALPIPQGATASITGIVQGRTRTTLANIFAADVFGTVYRQPSGDVTILGTPVVTSNTTTAGPSVDFYVDTGSQTFGIKVTGQAATNWDWGAIVTIATNA